MFDPGVRNILPWGKVRHFSNTPSKTTKDGTERLFAIGGCGSLPLRNAKGARNSVRTFDQVSCDSGAGDKVGRLEARVAGIGPQIGYIFPINEVRGIRRVAPG
jgi:hypothetical protein